jgi:hypothetical protein
MAPVMAVLAGVQRHSGDSRPQLFNTFFFTLRHYPVAFRMVSTYAEEIRLSGAIEEQIALAERLDICMAAVDRKLAARQEQLYSGDDAIYREAIGATRQEIANATDQVDTWKGEISRMKKECYDLRQRVAGLSPGEQGPAAERLEDLRRKHVVAQSRLITVQNRIADMLDRVLYITERH